MAAKICAGAFGRGGNGGKTLLDLARQDRMKRQRYHEMLQQEEESFLTRLRSGETVIILAGEEGDYDSFARTQSLIERLINLVLRYQDEFMYVADIHHTHVRAWKRATFAAKAA